MMKKKNVQAQELFYIQLTAWKMGEWDKRFVSLKHPNERKKRKMLSEILKLQT